MFCLKVQSIVFFRTGKSNFIIAKIIDLKCLQNHSRYHFAVQAVYRLVNLWILSGRLSLDSSSTADSSWLFCIGSRLKQTALLARQCSLPGLCVQDLISTESACPCVLVTHLSALHLSFLPFCKHMPWHDIFKNFGIHPQYGFLLIKAGVDCTYYWLCNPMTICTAPPHFPPLCISVKSTNNILPHFHNLFSLSFLFSYFPFLYIFFTNPLWPQPFLYATRDQRFCKASVTDVIKIGIWYTRCPLVKCPWPELAIVP